MIELIRVFLNVFVSAVFFVAGFQLHRGEWTALVFSRNAPFGGDAQSHLDAEINRARWAAPACFCAGAALLALLLFALTGQLGLPGLSAVFSAISDIAMIAFVVLIVRLYLKMGVTDDKKARFRTSNTRTSIFVIVGVFLLLFIALLY